MIEAKFKTITPETSRQDSKLWAETQFNIIQSCYANTYPLKSSQSLKEEIEENQQLVFFSQDSNETAFATAALILDPRRVNSMEFGRVAKRPKSKDSAKSMIQACFSILKDGGQEMFNKDPNKTSIIWSNNRAEPPKKIDGQEIPGGFGIHKRLQSLSPIFCGIRPLYIGQDGRSEPFSHTLAVKKDLITNWRPQVSEAVESLGNSHAIKTFLSLWKKANFPNTTFLTSRCINNTDISKTVISEFENTMTVNVNLSGTNVKTIDNLLEQGFRPLMIDPQFETNQLILKMIKLKPGCQLIIPFKGIELTRNQNQQDFISFILKQLGEINIGGKI